MDTEKMNDLLEGCALLEIGGNYYEYVGHHNGKVALQDVSSDYFIEVDIIRIKEVYPEASIAYKGIVGEEPIGYHDAQGRRNRCKY